MHEKLRNQIASCHAVIHVAGEVYGAEPLQREADAPRRNRLLATDHEYTLVTSREELERRILALQILIEQLKKTIAPFQFRFEIRADCSRCAFGRRYTLDRSTG